MEPPSTVESGGLFLATEFLPRDFDSTMSKSSLEVEMLFLDLVGVALEPKT